MITPRILYQPFFAIMTGISLLTQQPCLAAAQGKDAQATQKKGQVVTLSVGEGFSPVAAILIKADLEKQGCTNVELKYDPDVDEGYIEVSKGEYWDDFDSSGKAGSYAKFLCDQKDLGSE